MAKPKLTDDDDGEDMDPDDRPTAMLTYDPNEYRDFALPIAGQPTTPPEEKGAEKVLPKKF